MTIEEAEQEIRILQEQLKNTDELFRQYGAFMFGAGLGTRDKEKDMEEPLTEDELSIMMILAHEGWKRRNNFD